MRHINNDGLWARVAVSGDSGAADGANGASGFNTDDLLWEFVSGE